MYQLQSLSVAEIDTLPFVCILKSVDRISTVEDRWQWHQTKPHKYTKLLGDWVTIKLYIVKYHCLKVKRRGK